MEKTNPRQGCLPSCIMWSWCLPRLTSTAPCRPNGERRNCTTRTYLLLARPSPLTRRHKEGWGWDNPRVNVNIQSPAVKALLYCRATGGDKGECTIDRVRIRVTTGGKTANSLTCVQDDDYGLKYSDDVWPAEFKGVHTYALSLYCTTSIQGAIPPYSYYFDCRKTTPQDASHFRSPPDNPGIILHGTVQNCFCRSGDLARSPAKLPSATFCLFLSFFPHAAEPSSSLTSHRSDGCLYCRAKPEMSQYRLDDASQSNGHEPWEHNSNYVPRPGYCGSPYAAISTRSPSPSSVVENSIEPTINCSPRALRFLRLCDLEYGKSYDEVQLIT
ncbi:Pc12g03730 [Penicillium rubens Wisconsin 54-1255]|uniref:Pc12g03730 protein n=1 Tax=Penicillium rubens (strain ATCC 28089 / DSM 1075 / NRRL 1951 / Wisconsin 54-1255) TaxID=500485 RepID=B6GWZ4_PENRW|nr:Pc12g03730 [Penicillium rubens Wisconsin 54-1255]